MEISGHTSRKHRRDSIQGTDYIANYFFLNLTVSRANIYVYKFSEGYPFVIFCPTNPWIGVAM